MKKQLSLLILCLPLLTISCKENKEKEKIISTENTTSETTGVLNPKDFDTIVNGKQVKLYTLKNGNGMEAYFTNYGGRLVSLLVPNAEGEKTDVIVGMGSYKLFKESSEPYFGATIGPFGNRIAKGQFSLDGESYQVPINNGENTLHSGEEGFHNVIWEASQPDEQTLVLEYLSEDMEQGFPGNLQAKVTYSLTDENELKMQYEATTDKPTVVNLTNHAFFNLNGEGSGSILDHSLQIYADKFTPVDEGLIPTGELKDVEGTAFDFREPKTIGEDIEADSEQLRYGKGYDHNFVLNETKARGFNHAATVIGNESGIVMNIYTEEPGLQFYSGNFMKSSNTLKSGAKDDFRTAIALETQHFPDSPNQPEFPSTVLRPGETYSTTSLYDFDVVGSDNEGNN